MPNSVKKFGVVVITTFILTIILIAFHVIEEQSFSRQIVDFIIVAIGSSIMFRLLPTSLSESGDNSANDAQQEDPTTSSSENEGQVDYTHYANRFEYGIAVAILGYLVFGIVASLIVVGFSIQSLQLIIALTLFAVAGMFLWRRWIPNLFFAQWQKYYSDYRETNSEQQDTSNDYSMPSQSLIPQPNRTYSIFLTTGKNDVITGLANIAIISAYFTAIYLINNALKIYFENQGFLGFALPVWLTTTGFYISLILLLIPSIVEILSRPGWFASIKQRRWLWVWSIGYIISIAWKDTLAFSNITFPMISAIVSFAILRLLWTWRLRRAGFGLILALSVAIVWAQFSQLAIYAVVSSFAVYGIISIISLYLLTMIYSIFSTNKSVSSIWSSMRTVNTDKAASEFSTPPIDNSQEIDRQVEISRNKDQKIKFIQVIISVIMIIVIAVILLSGSVDSVTWSIFYLLSAVTISNYRRFLNHQRESWRMVTRRIRQNVINRLVSPTTTGVNALSNWFGQQIGIPVSSRATLGLQFAIFVGAIIIPVLEGFRLSTIPFLLSAENVKVTNAIQNLEILHLGIVGTFSTFVTVSVYGFLWFMATRPKHLLLPFQTQNQNSEFNSLALIANEKLLEQLQRIGILLSIRQIEDTNTNGEESVALFVSGEQEDELLEQISSIVTVESEGVRYSLRGLVALIIRMLARTQITGRVEQRGNGTIDITVTYTRRNGQTITSRQELQANTSSNAIINQDVEKAMEQIAIDLVTRLGQIKHLVSSAESFYHFLRGLEASEKRYWWQAIAAFRQSIHMEDNQQPTFTMGYYHLGASLIYQGDFESGLKYLRSAEASGTPLAEVQYMLALCLSFIHWDELHLDLPYFKQIVSHCRKAIRLRPNFPEAYHMLAGVYYRRARLEDRQWSRTYRPKDELESYLILVPRKSEYYQRAAGYLQRAIHDYDRMLRNLRNRRTARGELTREHRRIVHDRMVATHQLGDSLRALSRHAEADSYYEDFLTAYPGNLRTLTDRAQNYCLAGSWQRAEEFLREQIFSIPSAKWHPDAHLYMGWALAGGLAEELQHVSGISSNLLVRWVILQNSQVKPPYIVHPPERLIGIFCEAFSHLDFAITQRARFMSSWRQTNWQKPFIKAFEHITTIKGKETAPKGHQVIYTSYLAPDTDVTEYAQQLQLWLIWRMHSYGHATPETNDPLLRQFITITASGEKIDITKFFETRPTDNHNNAKLKEFGSIYDNLCKYRKLLVNTLKFNDKQQAASGLQQQYRLLRIAKRCIVEWENAENSIQNFLGQRPSNSAFTFAERWTLDVFAELSMMLCRLLAETHAFEVLEKIAKRSSDCMQKWLNQWHAYYNKKYGFYNFSAHTSRYQHASLLSWQAYAALRQINDHNTLTRLIARNDNVQHIPPHKSLSLQSDELNYRISNAEVHEDNILENSIKLLRESEKRVQIHPLSQFVHSQIEAYREQYPEAIATTERLIKLIAPFDPNNYIGNWETKGKGRNTYGTQGRGTYDIERRDNILQIASDSDHTRSILRYYERASGRDQFESIISKTDLHLHLSSFFEKTGDDDASIDNLLLALIWSPYGDAYFENFYRLATRLYELDRFPETLAVVAEANARRFDVLPLYRSATRRRDVRILQCIVLTREKQYFKAINLSKNILPKIQTYNTLIQRYLDFNCQEIYKIIKRIKEEIEKNPQMFDENSKTRVENLLNSFKQFSNILAQQPKQYTEDYLQHSFITLNIDELCKDESVQNALEALDDDPLLGYDLAYRRTVMKILSHLKQNMRPHEIYKPVSLNERFSNVLSQDVINSQLQDVIKTNLLDDEGTNFAHYLNPHQSGKLLTKWLKDLEEELSYFNYDNKLLNIDEIIISQVIHNLAESAHSLLKQKQRILNNTAYNHAQLKHSGEQLQNTHKEIITALVINCGISTINSEIQKTSQRERIQILDTWAWLIYRESQLLTEIVQEGTDALDESKLKMLKNAQDILEMENFEQSENLAVPNYHLSRIYFSRMRILWRQWIRQLSYNFKELELHQANPIQYTILDLQTQIDRNLYLALSRWSRANELDTQNRIQDDLLILRQRIEVYRNIWEIYQTTGKIGQINALP